MPFRNTLLFAAGWKVTVSPTIVAMPFAACVSIVYVSVSWSTSSTISVVKSNIDDKVSSFVSGIVPFCTSVVSSTAVTVISIPAEDVNAPSVTV